MKFAANIELWWTDIAFLDRINAASDAGFEAVEIWELEGKDIDKMARRLEDFQMKLTQFTAWGWEKGMNHPDNLAAFVEQISEACKVGRRLNCSMGTVVGGDDQPGMTQKEMHDQITTGLKAVVPIVEENEFMLILEPMNIRVDHPGHCLYGSAPGIKICREVDSPMVKLNWDLYHMQITEGDLCGHIREGIDQIAYLQLADHPGRHEPGTGEINYKKVLEEAAKLGYSGYVGLECTPQENEKKALERINLL
ncbi:MAG: TIM barrel protein [Bacteroidetes bacterium]|nr:TIM barrel protein [Bacteroidota bacterium]